MHIRVSNHAVERFKSRFGDRLPEGAGEEEVKGYISTLAAEALSRGGKPLLRTDSVRITVQGIKMIADLRLKDTAVISTVLCKTMHKPGNRILWGKPSREQRAKAKRSREDADDGW